MAPSAFGLELPTVGDMGELPTRCRSSRCPTCRSPCETLRIIFPYALTLALVGLLESLLTAQLLDDMTDTDSDKNRESRGQGIANVATGFLGGMAGCAMIGQSMINHRSGGRTRLSTLASGLFLLVLDPGHGRSGGPDSDGGAGRGDDHGVDRHVQLAQHPARER